MEWIKRINLKQALFTITLINLFIAALFSALIFQGCRRLNEKMASRQITLQLEADTFSVQENVALGEQSKVVLLGDAIAVLQIALPMSFFIIALLVTAAVFYRWKLKVPLALLTDSANRIMNHDLDFALSAVSEDELGQLCIAFEMMRQSLLENNRALWRQTEERKRLNAAFSHDLRNPVTVLKGSAKMARQCASDDAGQREELLMHLTRIEDYTDRIERYIETMSSVQRLEQIRVERVAVEFAAIAGELEAAVRFVASDSEKQVIFYCADASKQLLLDRNILFQIAENLVSNALRYARQTISITLSLEDGLLVLLVVDDGSGFSGKLLENGVQPFQKGDDDAAHLGMGLYSCMLLCQKHGGFLKIENKETGAMVHAALKISENLSDF